MDISATAAAIPEHTYEDNDIYKPEGMVMLRIEQFSDFAREGAYSRRLSDAVHIWGLSWKILAIPNKTKGCLAYYLQCNADDNADANWSCAASATLRIIAQKEGKEDLVKEISHTFHAKENDWGFTQFMTFNGLMDPEKGWYDEENDTVILSVDVKAEAPHGVKIRASLVDQQMYLLTSGKNADVNFLVGTGEGKKEQFTAHKAILATVSDVFDRMFDIDAIRGNSDKMIEVTDVKPEAFRLMLVFIYTKRSGGLNQNNVFDVLHAAKKYDITDLIDACADCPILNVSNVLYALGTALLYDLKGLIDRCWKFIDQNAFAVLKNDQFLEIDQTLLSALFARDQLDLNNKEIVIWNAALRWTRAQCRKRNMEAKGDNRRQILGPALFNIRFPLIPKAQFASVVVPTKVLTDEEMLSVLLYHVHPKNGVPGHYPLKFSSKVRASK